jgi:hypothetical protein
MPGASDAPGKPTAHHTEASVFSYEASLQKQIDLVSRLRQQVEGLFNITDVRTTDQGEGVVFIGQLRLNAEAAYGTLRERFNGLGYTPVLRREGNNDVVVAHRGVFAAVRFNPISWGEPLDSEIHKQLSELRRIAFEDQDQMIIKASRSSRQHEADAVSVETGDVRHRRGSGSLQAHSRRDDPPRDGATGGHHIPWRCVQYLPHRWTTAGGAPWDI